MARLVDILEKWQICKLGLKKL